MSHMGSGSAKTLFFQLMISILGKTRAEIMIWVRLGAGITAFKFIIYIRILSRRRCRGLERDSDTMRDVKSSHCPRGETRFSNLAKTTVWVKCSSRQHTMVKSPLRFHASSIKRILLDYSRYYKCKVSSPSTFLWVFFREKLVRLMSFISMLLSRVCAGTGWFKRFKRWGWGMQLMCLLI